MYAGSVDGSFPAMTEPTTPERAALEAALVNIPQLAEKTGLSPHTIRSVLLGRRGLRGPNRRKLAAALRTHSADLARLADELDPR